MKDVSIRLLIPYQINSIDVSYIIIGLIQMIFELIHRIQEVIWLNGVFTYHFLYFLSR